MNSYKIVKTGKEHLAHSNSISHTFTISYWYSVLLFIISVKNQKQFFLLIINDSFIYYFSLKTFFIIVLISLEEIEIIVGLTNSKVLPPPLGLTTHTCSFKSTTLAILQPRFCKVDYRSVNVQCPNSTQDNTVLMMVLEAVM